MAEIAFQLLREEDNTHHEKWGNNTKAKKGWVDSPLYKRRPSSIQASGKVTVPHPKKDIPVGTLRNIYRQADWQWR